MANSTDHDRKPWERLDNETDRAWACFEVYRGMHPKDRSMDAVYRKCYEKGQSRHAPKFFQDWVKKYDWKERAAAYDRYLDSIALDVQEKAFEQETEKQAREWAKRRVKIRESGWQRHERLLRLADTLIEKCDVIASLPITKPQKVKGKNGQEIHVHPIDVKASDAATMARAAAKLVEAADKIGRMAAEMETDRVLMQLIDDIDLGQLTDDEIERLSNATDPNQMQRELRLIQGGRTA